MATEDEIVKLVIDAENLSSDELRKAADDVDRLGTEAVAANKELKKLKVDKANIDSFERLGDEVNELEDDFAKATAEYKKSAAALRANKNATDEDRIALERQKIALTEQRKVLNANQLAYRKLTAGLKEIGINTKNAAEKKEELNAAITKLKVNTDELRNKYNQQAKALQTSITKEKEAIRVSKQKADAHKRAATAVEKEAAAKIKSIKADQKVEAESRRTTAALIKYEAALEKLNAELKEGVITKGQYIKSEQKLRQSLKLTERQANVTRRAVEADAVTNNKRRKSTDLLTTSTRRLAQAYTVLVFAQKAAQAVGASVKGYGELEAAMAKVEKTTGLTKDKLLEISEALEEQASEVTPAATTELLRYAEVAGQLGVEGTENILAIASAADILAVSTDLAGDEAVTLLTRMLQMSGEGVPAIHNLSSSMVELGNNTAATESEIAFMTKEVLTGTASLNLGSAAAAAWGATLKESGQQAERSRGALTKLSNAIKSASVKGGEDLERLAALTGLTADQIEENLGDRPEVVMQAFVEGLRGVKDEGGLVSETLKSFGIDGILAQGVLEKLADSSDRLARNVNLSNEAFISADKHIDEATKAYATQEAQLGRLANQFTALKVKAGEAFSDETYESANALSDLMDEQEGNVAELVNQFVQLGETVLETLSGLEQLGESLNLLGSSGIVLTTLKVALNDIQIGINVITASILQVRIAWAEWTGSSIEEINKLRAAQDEAFKSMEGNIQDIANAEADWNETSSATYRDLVESADKYSDALKFLSDAQRKELEESLKSSNFKVEHNKQYAALTSAIIKAQRQLEAEARKIEIVNKAREISNKAKQEEIEIQNELNETLATFGDDISNYTEELKRIHEQYKSGEITLNDYLEKQKALESAVEELNSENQKVVGTQKAANKEFGSATDALLSLVSNVRKYTNEISDLKNALEGLDEGTLEYQEAVLKLQKAQENLARSSADLETLRKVEVASISELLAMQREHNLELQKLEQLRATQQISELEYNKRLEETRFKTELLNDAIGKTTKSTAENTAAIEENTDALDSNSQAQSKNASTTGSNKSVVNDVTTAVSAWMIMQNRLNQELDYSSESTDELKQKTKDLEGEYRFARKTVGGWWDDIIEMNNAFVRKQQTTIQATIAMRDYTEEVQNSSHNLQELARFAQRADRLSKILGENQLRPLRDAIEEAKDEFKDLNDTINDSFDDVQDRLDAILGNEKAIVKRQFEREMQELLDLLDQARESGDNKLVSTIREAIAKLEQAQKLEFKEQFGENKPSNSNSNRNNQNNNINDNSGFGGSGNTTHTVNVVLPTGQTVSFNTASQSDADNAVAALALMGEVNIEGVN